MFLLQEVFSRGPTLEPPTPIRPPSPIDWEEIEARVPKPERWEKLSPRERQVYLLRFSVTPPMPGPRVAELLGMKPTRFSPMWAGIRKKTGIDSMEAKAKQVKDVTSGRVPTGEFLVLLEQAARRALRSMDAHRMAKADLKSLAGAVRDIMTMRNLILGEPTQIIGSDSRRKLDEVAALILKETVRRGLAIRNDPNTGMPLIDGSRIIDVESAP
jgi:hypothetical protein